MIIECIELNWVFVFPDPRPSTWSPALALNLYLPALAPNLYLPNLAPNLYLPNLATKLHLMVLAPNLDLPNLVPNLYLPAQALNFYLPVLAPNFYLPTLASPEPELAYTNLVCPPQFVFTDPDLRFVLPGSELVFTFLLVAVAAVVNISSSCNFFGLDNTNISIPILVFPSKVGKANLGV